MLTKASVWGVEKNSKVCNGSKAMRASALTQAMPPTHPRSYILNI